jgi:hypothetical protein
MKLTWWKYLVLSVLAAGVFAAGVVHAQSTGEAGKRAPTLRKEALQLSEGQKAVAGELHALRLSYMEKLKAEMKDVIEKAVADGRLTREEADQMLARLDSHPAGFRKGHGMKFRPGPEGFMHRKGWRIDPPADGQ